MLRISKQFFIFHKILSLLHNSFSSTFFFFSWKILNIFKGRQKVTMNFCVPLTQPQNYQFIPVLFQSYYYPFSPSILF